MVYDRFASQLFNTACAVSNINDLHAYDPAASLWYTPGILSGPSPSAREALGLAALSGNLYLFGGGPHKSTGSVHESLSS